MGNLGFSRFTWFTKCTRCTRCTRFWVYKIYTMYKICNPVHRSNFKNATKNHLNFWGRQSSCEHENLNQWLFFAMFFLQYPEICRSWVLLFTQYKKLSDFHEHSTFSEILFLGRSTAQETREEEKAESVENLIKLQKYINTPEICKQNFEKSIHEIRWN